jgi:hypothetical protein
LQAVEPEKKLCNLIAAVKQFECILIGFNVFGVDWLHYFTMLFSEGKMEPFIPPLARLG